MSKKTNAARYLDQLNISYTVLIYDTSDGSVDGDSVVIKLDKSAEVVFKTLVVQGASKSYYVCVIPVEGHLNLKKVAKEFAFLNAISSVK